MVRSLLNPVSCFAEGRKKILPSKDTPEQPYPRPFCVLQLRPAEHVHTARYSTPMEGRKPQLLQTSPRGAPPAKSLFFSRRAAPGVQTLCASRDSLSTLRHVPRNDTCLLQARPSMRCAVERRSRSLAPHRGCGKRQAVEIGDKTVLSRREMAEGAHSCDSGDESTL